jgi:5,10-methylene-tetrahydrofolate dehydrogenase/methenyl tetrahydrofolate cyclohydrolase
VYSLSLNFDSVKVFAFMAMCAVGLLCCCATSTPGKIVQRKTAGKTFVIVGASSGFGKGVAEEIGRYGANVVLAARRTELLEEIAKEIQSAKNKTSSEAGR